MLNNCRSIFLTAILTTLFFFKSSSQKTSANSLKKCNCNNLTVKGFNEKTSSANLDRITYYDILDFIEQINFIPKKVTQEKFKSMFIKVFSNSSRFTQLKIEAMYFIAQNGSYLKSKFSKNYCEVNETIFAQYGCYFQIVLKIEELINNTN